MCYGSLKVTEILQVDRMANVNNKWQCRRCTWLCDSERDFAQHLRTHLTGHRARQYRKPAKATTDIGTNCDKKITPSTSFVKFDSLSTSQFEISQPNSITNLMHVNIENHNKCEQLVDPSLVMPSKHNETIENTEFNYTEVLNLSGISKYLNVDSANNMAVNPENESSNDTSMNSENNLEALLNDPVNIQSMAELHRDLNQGNCATITPLNLYYIDGENFSETPTENVGSPQTVSEQPAATNATDETDNLNQQSKVVLVDNNMFDETVRLIDFNGQIVSGKPVEIVPIENGDAQKSNQDFFCEICNKQFAKSAYLYRHLRKHLGEFTCKYCDMQFSRKETWLTHSCAQKQKAEKESSVNVDDPDIVPDNILISYPLENGKKAVVIKINDASKPCSEPKKRSVQCEVCNLVLSDKSCLNRHMLRHEQAVCYTCVYCGAVLKHRHSVRRHLRLYHPEYKHEWNNSEFVTSLQTDIKKQAADSNEPNKPPNTKKNKYPHKKKGKGNLKIPMHCPKKDSLIGTTGEDTRMDFDCHTLNGIKTMQSTEYFQNNSTDKSIHGVRDDSLDLSSFNAHFDEEIGQLSFQALALPDVFCKGISGEIVKIDSKENSPIKNFNISSLLLLNKNGASKKSATEPNNEVTSIVKTVSPKSTKTELILNSMKDSSVFCSQPYINTNEKRIPLMPSMPVLFCEEEQNIVSEKPDNFNGGVEILVCQPVTDPVVPTVTKPDFQPSLVVQEETNPSCSAGYVLEENSSMQLVDTSTDFTFFVLG